MPKPLIALINDDLSTFQKTIARSLDKSLRTAGFDMLCVCGGPLRPNPTIDSPAGSNTRNAIYEIARNYDVAGFVVLTSVIGNHASIEELTRFTHMFSHRPLVSFGVDIPDVASVTINNYEAMTVMMRHMTRHQTRRRFAFVRGFPDGPISIEREKAFRDVLTERGLELDEQLFVNGNFKAADSFFAMDELLQKRTDIDAVVAANDTMALSAVHALRKHGLNIPRDVIVSGFDNTTDAEQSIPAITTINVSLQEHVDATVTSLQEQFAQLGHDTGGKSTREPEKSHICSTHLVIRGSSDPAPARPILNADESKALFDTTSFSENFTHNMKRVQSPVGVSINEIVEDVTGILVNGSQHSDARLKNALNLLHDNPADVVWWRHLHYQMGKNIQEQGYVGLAPDALTLTTSIMSMIQTTLWSVEASEQVLESRYHELVMQLRRQLSETTIFDDVVAVLHANAELFKLSKAFICLYEHSGGYPAENARLIYQHPAGTIDFPTDRFFPGRDVLPTQYLRSSISQYMLIEPLCIGSTHLGYLVMDETTGNFPGRVNPKALSDNICNALYRCF